MRWAEHVARMGEDTGVQRVQLTFYRVTITEAAYIQLRRRPPEDERDE